MNLKEIERRLRGHRLGRLGDSAAPVLPDFNDRHWSDYQKLAASMLASVAASQPSFLNEEITTLLPPADSKGFIQTPKIFPAYPAPGAAPVIILTYTAPQGSIAVINKIAIVHIGGNPPDGTGNVLWQVVVNGAGVKGLNQLTSQVGTYAAPNDIEILLFEGDVINVTVQIPAGGAPQPGSTAARFHGWTLPLSEAILPANSQQ